MKPVEFAAFGTKMVKAYESCCTDVCRKNGLNQTSFDVIMFLINNPEYNTARDLCEIRGIRTGNASVAIENLVQTGYLLRQPDPKDRRKLRLVPTDKALAIADEGHQAQKRFWELVSNGITQEELRMYDVIMKKIMKNVTAIVQGKRGERS